MSRTCGGGIQAHIAGVEVDQLLYPSAGVVEHAQQDGISATGGRTQIGLGEDLREEFLGEVANASARMSPQRNGEDLLALQQALGHFRLHIAEERVQSREAMVLRADRGMPVVAKVIEERLHQGCIDVGERQSFQGDAAHVATEAEQEREHIAVGFDGVGAQIALCSQVMR